MTQARDLREAAGGPLASQLSPKYLEEHCLIPLGVGQDGAVEIAASKEADASVRDELALVFGRRLRFIDAPAGEILAAIMSSKRDTSTHADDAAAGTAEQVPLDDLESLANQAPVIKLVNVLLLDAVRMRATDIHVESTADGLRVRYRLDGVLQDVSRLARQYRAAVVSRIKIIAGLDIAERRIAQDGRARVRLADREVDMRISTLPALHGESVVLRILDHAGHGRGLSELGMPDSVLDRFGQVITRSSGMVLVTGPTGSGKTTTLYAALKRVNAAGVKIVTIEDPVEYQIDGVIQIPVNPKTGFGFDVALRSILRHDPDIIMIGEMRDRATAELAIQAALTGHLVFSTLHTVDSASAVTRLVDMGIEPFLVAATLQGIVAQRLLRKLCDNCAEEYHPDVAELESAPPEIVRGGKFRRAAGCDACAQTGYSGRTGIYEYLGLTDAYRTLFVRGRNVAELRAAIREDGIETLSDAGWREIAAGRTSIAELARVVNDGSAG